MQKELFVYQICSFVVDGKLICLTFFLLTTSTFLSYHIFNMQKYVTTNSIYWERLQEDEEDIVKRGKDWGVVRMRA